nr:ribonuclease H-like domain-containing protein [Tanacetum cinerariifolium]
MITRSYSGIVKPIDCLSLNTFLISSISKNPFNALKYPQWRNAMYDEYNALVKNGTWTLSRYKACLVANGGSQQLGVDFDETFSSVVKPAAIRTVLSLVVSRKWPIHQLDVKNAFLNGDFLAGGLQYLTFTRPNLSYAVKQVCLYMHNPREPHFVALKHILRYVRGTVDFSLQLYALATTSLVGYIDVDWAGCPSTRSAEVEYRDVANVVAKTAWLRNLPRELHSPLSTATLIYCDNVSVVYMSVNPV